MSFVYTSRNPSRTPSATLAASVGIISNESSTDLASLGLTGSRSAPTSAPGPQSPFVTAASTVTLSPPDPTDRHDAAAATPIEQQPDPDDGRPAELVAAQASRDRQQREVAIAKLLKMLEDDTDSNRLKTLQNLFSYSSADNPAIGQALRKALQDPDPTIVACAVEAIAARDDAEALGALTDTFRTGDLSTKLLIIDSVTSNMAAHSILQEGLSDPAEEVRDAAKAALYAFASEQSSAN
jgi:hypothetical protein